MYLHVFLEKGCTYLIVIISIVCLVYTWNFFKVIFFTQWSIPVTGFCNHPIIFYTLTWNDTMVLRADEHYHCWRFFGFCCYVNPSSFPEELWDTLQLSQPSYLHGFLGHNSSSSFLDFYFSTSVDDKYFIISNKFCVFNSYNNSLLFFYSSSSYQFPLSLPWNLWGIMGQDWYFGRPYDMCHH